MTRPGIGPTLARRLADDEDIETLEELEMAGASKRQSARKVAVKKAAVAAPPAPVRGILTDISILRDAAAGSQARGHILFYE